MTLPGVSVGDIGHVSHHNLMHDRYNNSVEVLSGNTASRPGAGTVDAGTLYWDTDTELLYRSSGAVWDQLSAGVGDHGALTGLADDDHPHYATAANLAAHNAAGDPHTGYRLESADHTHASTGLQAGTIDHGVLTGLADNDHPQYAIPAYVGFHAAMAADQVIASATQTTVVFDEETIASADYVHTTGIFTAPKAGKYLITYSIYWAGHATGARGVNVFKNNAVSGSTPDSYVNSTHSANPFAQTGAGVISLALNDNLRVIVRQASGGNLSVIRLEGWFGGRASHFGVSFLGV